ncbi:MAG: MBL fold metallo-hydrolase [Candidatus Edwardsbacteria bacterium]|nr:MBL fold metallo-hydrolase [Candidatus Edwardsbacteria bacterium]
MKLNLWVLTSGSSGNCILLWSGKNAIMVDCGIGPRSLTPYLEQAGLEYSDLDGVLVTHLHGDHVRTALVKKLMREGVPLHCHQRIVRYLAHANDPAAAAIKPRLLHSFADKMFNLGSFRVKPFGVFHDAPGGCFGYSLYTRVKSGIKKISIATDIGEYDQALVKRFANSDVMIIESNYDDHLLELTGRPQILKDRIRQVHFSNDQCVRFLNEVLARSTRLPKVIIQAHVSQESNTVAVAGNHLKSRLRHGHRQQIRFVETHHLRESEIVTLE